MQASTATANTGRIAALDLLRGVAILGTLASNIWIFTDPRGPAGVLTNLPSTDSIPGVVETVLRFTANGKFLALLTILFGIGMELQYRSALRHGRSWPGWYLWRTALLFVEGTLHYMLIFEFDVLMGYALVSFRVAYLLARTERAIRAWMWTVGTVSVLVLLSLTAVLVTAPDSTTPTAGGTELYTEGSWLDQVGQRLLQAPVYRLELLLIVPSGIVLFLLGARLLRAGAFENSRRGLLLRQRLMRIGLGVGVPCNLVVSFAGADWALVGRYLLPPVVAVGILGLVTETTMRMRRQVGPVRRALSEVGRAALSCYVLQNLLASILCYGWGFGLADQLAGARPWWVVGAWAGICAILVLFCRWWLRYFSRGPVELAWHWAYTAPQRARTADHENRPVRS
ncbi:DUF418 domain-containing protein [Haloactinomyces albus]|uniref:DUF418 domain-containing protein n=1 Tax=Haloactinomyces albus TaxID=1352928 RepID=A0AAE3ZEM9_9ACTN|nr:DUF418 domain-containing protein [Haloactinomyces albus]MDR7302243.1 uncharacterized protein [Haloactinomyces albus]